MRTMQTSMGDWVDCNKDHVELSKRAIIDLASYSLAVFFLKSVSKLVEGPKEAQRFYTGEQGDRGPSEDRGLAREMRGRLGRRA